VGGYLDNDPRDKRRTEYIRRARSRIDRLWAFPKWAALEGMQGTVIVTFVINADGSVANATVTRPSGIADFDESCRQAVVRGGPYGPLPPELGSSYRWSLPFEARNPAVRPKDVSASQ
jgi:TonB family protein